MRTSGAMASPASTGAVYRRRRRVPSGKADRRTRGRTSERFCGQVVLLCKSSAFARMPTNASRHQSGTVQQTDCEVCPDIPVAAASAATAAAAAARHAVDDTPDRVVSVETFARSRGDWRKQFDVRLFGTPANTGLLRLPVAAECRRSNDRCSSQEADLTAAATTTATAT